MKIYIYKILNHFCFSHRHHNNCDGCIFKQIQKCPIAHMCDLLTQ